MTENSKQSYLSDNTIFFAETILVGVTGTNLGLLFEHPFETLKTK